MPEVLRDQIERMWGTVDAHVEPMAHNQYLTAAVWRVTAGAERAIVKQLRRPGASRGSAWDRHWTANSSAESRWNFWEREALAYGCGLVDMFAPDGIRGPACIAIDRTAEHIHLWLAGVAMKGPCGSGCTHSL